MFIHSFKSTVVKKAVHSVAQLLSAMKDAIFCAHVVSFPDQRPWSLVWEVDKCTSKIVDQQALARLTWFLPIVVGKAYEYHVGKALH